MPRNGAVRGSPPPPSQFGSSPRLDLSRFPSPGAGASEEGEESLGLSACLFKKPRGAPRKPPGAAEGGHGRGRLAPGGRVSTTKLRPLSLRIGRAPQTRGGRARRRPSFPGAGRAWTAGGRGPQGLPRTEVLPALRNAPNSETERARRPGGAAGRSPFAP